MTMVVHLLFTLIHIVSKTFKQGITFSKGGVGMDSTLFGASYQIILAFMLLLEQE